MQISNLTGLPELPENHFWRIWSTSEDIYGWHRFVESGVYVEIVEFTSYVSSRKEWVVWPFYKRTIEMEGQQQQRLVSAAIRIPIAKGSIERRNADLEEVTEELILETAIEVYEKWSKKKAAASLLGDYPPKKIEAESKGVRLYLLDEDFLLLIKAELYKSKTMLAWDNPDPLAASVRDQMNDIQKLMDRIDVVIQEEQYNEGK